MICAFCEKEASEGGVLAMRIDGTKTYDGGWICTACFGDVIEQLFPPSKVTPIAESHPLPGGICVSCGRDCTVLNDGGECEGCVIEAMLQMRAW